MHEVWPYYRDTSASRLREHLGVHMEPSMGSSLAGLLVVLISIDLISGRSEATALGRIDIFLVHLRRCLFLQPSQATAKPNDGAD